MWYFEFPTELLYIFDAILLHGLIKYVCRYAMCP